MTLQSIIFFGFIRIPVFSWTGISWVPSVTTQGRSDSFWFVNLAIRQQLFSPHLQSTLSFRDIFNSARYRSDIETANLQSYTDSTEIPVITLTISYTFMTSSAIHRVHETTAIYLKGSNTKRRCMVYRHIRIRF